MTAEFSATKLTEPSFSRVIISHKIKILLYTQKSTTQLMSSAF